MSDEIRKVLSFLIVLQTFHVSACQSFRGQTTPIRTTLITDSTEVGVLLRGNAYVANIGFTFTNTTGRTISRAGCGGPGMPDLEKKVNNRWVPAYYPGQLACRTYPDFFWDAGSQIRSVLPFLAFEPGHNTMPELLVDSIDGLYRLHWEFTEGRKVGAKGAKRVDATSNEFHMTLRSSRSPASERR